MRTDRTARALRPVQFEMSPSAFAEGSCLFSLGKTRVLCTASVEEGIPPWKPDGSGGWITAEYSMLPRANRRRSPREAREGKQTGRTQEIQRLVGRSLRASVDLDRMGPYTVTLDCDVLQADGGTRCASICGATAALLQALQTLPGADAAELLVDPAAAISVGMVDKEIRLDLEYAEDARADVDLNLVMLASGRFVEVQASAEGRPFSREDLLAMTDLGREGIVQLLDAMAQQTGLGPGGKKR